MKSIGLLFFISFFLLFAACKTNTELVPRNMALLYNPVQTTKQPFVKVYHDSDKSVKIYLGLQKRDIAFIDNALGEKEGELDIYVKIYKGINMSFMQDSVFKNVKIIYSQVPDTLIYEFNFNIDKDKDYYLDLEVRDRLKNSRNQVFEKIFNDNSWGFEDFLMQNADDSSMVFYPILKKNTNYSIKADAFKTDTAYLYYLADKIPLALPPFYLKPLPDFVLNPKNEKMLIYQSDFKLKIENKGIYHLQKDTVPSPGVTMYYFNDNFPRVKTARDMAYSLRYLVSKSEYHQILNSGHIKYAIDSFWLAHSIDKVQAATLISEYYNRVEKANVYFTSFTEGWRTDRGMIYIILGAPTNVFIYKDKEIWRYGNRLSLNYTEFIFWKISNPISENHYLLERKIEYKPLWYNAASSWRSGIPFRYMN